MNNFLRLATVIGIVWIVSREPVGAQHSNMADEYYESQFNWCLYVDTQSDPNYLNYKGSRLNGITRSRIYFRLMPDGKSTMYEEMWYRAGKPLAMRRYAKLNVEADSKGAVILSSTKTNEESAASGNIALRIATEARANHQNVAAVVVPTQNFSEIARVLQHYNFSAKPSSDSGEQLSINLHSTDGELDEQLFFQSK